MPLPEKLTAEYRAFGKRFCLEAGTDPFTRDDSLWRLGEVYEPFLATTSLPLRGTALDIGAGFGCFTVAFARAFPDWIVWSFEPQNDLFTSLCANIKTLGLTNVIAVNAAIGGRARDSSGALGRGISNQNPDMVRAAARAETYFRHREKKGFVQSIPPQDPAHEFEATALPEIPANALLPLGADLLKMTAPQSETRILETLAPALPPYITGESWAFIPSKLIFDHKNPPEVSIALAGTPLRLRGTPNRGRLQAGLDIFIWARGEQTDLEGQIERALRTLGSDCRIVLINAKDPGEILRGAMARLGQAARVICLDLPSGDADAPIDFCLAASNKTHVSFVGENDRMALADYARLLDLARSSGHEAVAFAPEKPACAKGLTAFFDRAYTTGATAQLFGGTPQSAPPRPLIFRRDFLDFCRLRDHRITGKTRMADIMGYVRQLKEIYILCAPCQTRRLRAVRFLSRVRKRR